MKRLICLFALFCLFITAAACAEDYMPLKPTKAMLKSALASGRMLTSTYHFGIDFEENPSADEIESRRREAVQEMLSNLLMYSAVGKVDNGIRLETAMRYGTESASVVYADFSCVLDSSGVSLESSLLEGKRLCFSWDEVLSAAEISPEMLPLLAAAPHGGESFSSGVDADALAKPYLDVLAAFISSIPAETHEDIPEEGIFPAVGQEITWSFTEEQIAALLRSLAEVLADDDQLRPFLCGFGVDEDALSEFTEMLLQGAKDILDAPSGEVLSVHLGLSDHPLPAYLLVDISHPQSEDYDAIVAIAKQGEKEDSLHLILSTLVNKDGHSQQPVYAELNAAHSENAPLFYDAEIYAHCNTDDTMTVYQSEWNSAASPQEDGPDGYVIQHAHQLQLADADRERTGILTAIHDFLATKNGGESMETNLGFVLKEKDEEVFSADCNAYLELEPDENSSFRGDYGAVLTCPAAGVAELTVYGLIQPVDYDPAPVNALTVYSPGVMTEDERAALFEEAQQNVLSLLQSLFLRLPPALYDTLTEEPVPAP